MCSAYLKPKVSIKLHETHGGGEKVPQGSGAIRYGRTGSGTPALAVTKNQQPWKKKRNSEFKKGKKPQKSEVAKATRRKRGQRNPMTDANLPLTTDEPQPFLPFLSLPLYLLFLFLFLSLCLSLEWGTVKRKPFWHVLCACMLRWWWWWAPSDEPG